MQFRAGIVFGNRAIEGTDGITGSGTAISLAPGHTLDWNNTDQAIVGKIYCSNTNALTKTELRFAASGVQFIGNANQILASFPHVASSVNYLMLQASAGTTPNLAAAGSGIDIDVYIAPKGAGAVRFGTFAGTADVVCNGYITIKDAAGTVRKLMTTA